MNGVDTDNTFTCPRCDQAMPDRDHAEGCEDLDCPAIGGEPPKRERNAHVAEPFRSFLNSISPWVP